MSYKQPTDQPVLASAQRSAGSGSSNYINVRSYKYAMLALEVTAISGSPTLDVSLQCCPDPTKTDARWWTVYKEEQITTSDLATLPGRFLSHAQKGWIGYLRIVYTIAGTSTPKVTFSANIFCK